MNSYGLPHTPLKRACLPFPPPRHNAGIIRKYERFVNLEIQTCESCVFFPPDVVPSHRSASRYRSFVPYALRKAHSTPGALFRRSRGWICFAKRNRPRHSGQSPLQGVVSRTTTARFSCPKAHPFASTRCMRSRGMCPSCRRLSLVVRSADTRL